MKKILILTFVIGWILSGSAQGRIRIAYVDMDYILEKLPEYNQALTELDQKALKWKAQIEKMSGEIEDMKRNLEQEKVLLTKELLQEKEEEIQFKEKDLLQFQMAKFGPNGDYVLQKQNLIVPIQERVFNAVSKLIKAAKYDIIFDKSNENLGIIYSNPKLDISDKIIRIITKEKGKEEKKKTAKERKKEREQKIAEAKKKHAELAAQKKKEREEARKKALKEREEAKEKPESQDKTKEKQVDTNNKEVYGDKLTPEQLKNLQEKTPTLTPEQIREKRKKEREERRLKILKERKEKKENKNN